MAKVHMFLQGKGGVGKSFGATLLAQQMIEEGNAPLCIDIDPQNPTFSRYKALNVQRLEIMEGEEIDPSKFDAMIDMIDKATEADVIIDNGASSFLALANYIIGTEIPALLHSMEHTLIIHTMIIGGTGLTETVGEFARVVALFPEETKFVVWLNPVLGPVKDAGKEFTEFKAYKNAAHRISAIVDIPAFQQKTFDKDLKEMMASNLTFLEAIGTPGLSIVTRQRLTMMRRDLYQKVGEIAAIA
jgi:hypothetical protein